MEYIWLGLLILAVLVLCFYVPKRDHMTNKDLMATLDKFGKQGTNSSKKKTSSTDLYEEELYGPKAPKLEQPAPASSSGGTPANDTNAYPDIYGPEITPVPGMKKTNSKSKAKSKAGIHASDEVTDDDTYEFNPDFRKAFPMEEDGPQPFLTDFSKFQH